MAQRRQLVQMEITFVRWSRMVDMLNLASLEIVLMNATTITLTGKKMVKSIAARVAMKMPVMSVAVQRLLISCLGCFPS